MHMKCRLNHHKLARLNGPRRQAEVSRDTHSPRDRKAGAHRWQDLRTRHEPDPQQVLLRNMEPKDQDGMGRANTGPRDKALP